MDSSTCRVLTESGTRYPHSHLHPLPLTQSRSCRGTQAGRNQKSFSAPQV
ncbi:hypothetical protein QQP08_010518 [Theobroma cacao]|nr:hypothetical protein QQP08_010518 [Theobroma cacao]